MFDRYRKDLLSQQPAHERGGLSNHTQIPNPSVCGEQVENGVQDQSWDKQSPNLGWWRRHASVKTKCHPGDYERYRVEITRRKVKESAARGRGSAQTKDDKEARHWAMAIEIPYSQDEHGWIECKLLQWQS